MKKIDTCIRHSCQFLILILYETACVHLSSAQRSSIINESTSIIHGEEDHPLHLQCPFSLTNTVLKRNGRIVKESNMLGTLVYSLTPRKEDHNSTFSCEMYNLALRIRTKTTATLDINYKPYLSMNYTSNSVFEGQSVTLYCSSESRPKTIEMWWVMEGRLLSRKYDTYVLCHEIINISRADSGSYKCFAENEIDTENDEVIITVLYAPHIPDQHVNFTDTDISRTLQCLANGVPATYTYGQWQHLSHFGEHIRYLNPSADGKITLPPIAIKMERYQDNGIYLCTASNRVADSFGNSFQTGKTFVMSNDIKIHWKPRGFVDVLMSVTHNSFQGGVRFPVKAYKIIKVKGPPVFVEKIEHKQYGQPGKVFNLKFIVYSTSEIEYYNVKSENKEITASSEMTPVNSTMVFHGTEISVETIEVDLSFNIFNKSSSQDYTVTLFNVYSNSSFVVELKSVQVYEEEKKTEDTKVAIIIFSTLVVMCVPILGAAVFMRRKRQRRTSEDVSESESIEGQPVPVDNIVYQNATQSVAFRPTLIQTSAEVIEYNRGSCIQERNTAPLIGQLNYADVIFPPSATQDVVQIIGIENRTVYADVTVSAGV